MEFSDLKGKTLVSADVNSGSDVVTLTTDDGWIVTMYHEQNCCESVEVESVDGDIAALVGHPILMAEEVSESDPNASESGTWTFYKLATIKGYVTIRWYGQSNGYYSESVSTSWRKAA